MNDVAVLVCTFRRPDSLALCVRSLFAQTGVERRLREIVVVDNDPAGSAAAIIAELQAQSPVPLRHVREPRPGVATARNAGIAATDAPLIAILDDDETATAHWLASLIEVLERFDADVAFGPIRTVLPEGVETHCRYFQRFFARTGPAVCGLIDKPYGCGNSLLRRATALPEPAPFDPARDETGGEDDQLFAALQARGGRLAWAAEALAFEHAPKDRARLTYALRRAFAYGQGPARAAAESGDHLGVIRWMAIGAGQVGLWSALAGLAWVSRRPDRAEPLDRAARGLGKLFWARRFEPRFYGPTALSDGDARAARAKRAYATQPAVAAMPQSPRPR